MKLISWNVNGIRAVAKKGFEDFLLEHKPDVICLQEIKVHNDDLPEAIAQIGAEEGYRGYWNGADRKGYSGTATLTRIPPIACETKIGDERFDCEGRFQFLEFPDFFLINTYVPNVKHDLSRLNERQEFDQLLLEKIKELETTKPVILCGDMNVAHNPIDLARPKPNEGNAGYTLEERQGMTNYISADLIDTFRTLHPEKEQYSWWSYRGGARANNVGWRLDYFLTSQSLLPTVHSATIHDQVTGSDHCPIELVMKALR
ncbi:MAG: exodeoxyribonuclease III [Kiritimatiellae bacterium]|jgi:exodeoxyribonuclease-3|nr:exodeoxyribonuclease III [Kiritimatiellia bacterium]